jgi:hypothetical protein
MVIKSASEEEDPIRVPLGGLGLLHNNAVICRIFLNNLCILIWYTYIYVCISGICILCSNSIQISLLVRMTIQLPAY